MVKNLPTMEETRIRSLGQEDPLKKEMATHSSILALWTEALEESDSTEGLHSLHFLGPNSASSGAARSLRLGFPSLVPTLCDPIDCSPTGSPVPGILQARTLEWVAISFSNA